MTNPFNSLSEKIRDACRDSVDIAAIAAVDRRLIQSAYVTSAHMSPIPSVILNPIMAKLYEKFK
jgi:hypothetical protein